MSRIDPISQIFGVVRKNIEERQGSSGKTTEKASSTHSEVITPLDLPSIYHETVKRSGSKQAGLKAIVSAQLAHEFGESFLKDPKSKALIDKVVKDLEQLPKLLSDLEE